MIDKFIPHIYDLARSIETPKVWVPLVAIQGFIAQYIFSEWNFAIAFIGVYILDTLSGIYVAWRKKEYSSTVLREKLFDKTVAYFTIILAYSMATKMVLSGSETNVIKFFDIPFYSIFITAELFSIIKKWYEFRKWPVLKKLMSHFDGFDDKGNEKV